MPLQNGDVTASLRRIMEFIPRFFAPGGEHFFLLGPRGTGKTLWTRRAYSGTLRLDLLDPATHRQLAARPERLIEIIRGHPEAKQIVIDEIQKQGLYALEVKNAATVRPEDLRSLKNFREDYPESQLCLLYRGKERLLRDGIYCCPCEDFLRSLHPRV